MSLHYLSTGSIAFDIKPNMLIHRIFNTWIYFWIKAHIISPNRTVSSTFSSNNLCLLIIKPVLSTCLPSGASSVRFYWVSFKTVEKGLLEFSSRFHVFHQVDVLDPVALLKQIVGGQQILGIIVPDRF